MRVLALVVEPLARELLSARDVRGRRKGSGRDGRRWSALLGRPAARYDLLAEDVLGPLLRIPSHPVDLARFGLPTLLPATVLSAPARAITLTTDLSINNLAPLRSGPFRPARG